MKFHGFFRPGMCCPSWPRRKSWRWEIRAADIPQSSATRRGRGQWWPVVPARWLPSGEWWWFHGKWMVSEWWVKEIEWDLMGFSFGAIMEVWKYSGDSLDSMVSWWWSHKPYGRWAKLRCPPKLGCNTLWTVMYLNSLDWLIPYVTLALVGRVISPHLHPIGSMYAIYGNMDPINIPQMFAYIPAPWILWVSAKGHNCLQTCPDFVELLRFNRFQAAPSTGHGPRLGTFPCPIQPDSKKKKNRKNQVPDSRFEMIRRHETTLESKSISNIFPGFLW